MIPTHLVISFFINHLLSGIHRNGSHLRMTPHLGLQSVDIVTDLQAFLPLAPPRLPHLSPLEASPESRNTAIAVLKFSSRNSPYTVN